MDAVYTILDGYIDFEGQKLADTLSTTLLVISGALAFIVGFITQNLVYTLYVGLGGTLLTALVVIPPWPIYNKKPVRWLASEKSVGGVGIVVPEATTAGIDEKK